MSKSKDREAKHAPKTTQQLHDDAVAPKLCRNFAQFGSCRYGTGCRYEHVTPPQPPPRAPVGTPMLTHADARNLAALVGPPAIEVHSRLEDRQAKALKQLFKQEFVGIGTRYDAHAVLAHVRRTSEKRVLDEMHAASPLSVCKLLDGNPARTATLPNVWHCRPATNNSILARFGARLDAMSCYHAAPGCTCAGGAPDWYFISMGYDYTPAAIAQLATHARRGVVRWLLHPMQLAKGEIANELHYHKDGDRLVCTIDGTAGVHASVNHDWLFNADRRQRVEVDGRIVDLVWEVSVHLPEPCPTSVYTFAIAEHNPNSAETTFSFLEAVADESVAATIPTKDPYLKVFSEAVQMPIMRTQSFAGFFYVYASRVTITVPKRGIAEVARALKGTKHDMVAVDTAVRIARNALAKYSLSVVDQAGAIVPTAILGFLLHADRDMSLLEALAPTAKALAERHSKLAAGGPGHVFDPSALALATAGGRLLPPNVVAFARNCFTRLGGNNTTWTWLLTSPAATTFLPCAAVLAYAIHARDVRLSRHMSGLLLSIAATVGVVCTQPRWAKPLFDRVAEVNRTLRVPVLPYDGVFTFSRWLYGSLKTRPIVDVDAKSTRTESSMKGADPTTPVGRLSGVAVNRVAVLPLANASNAERALDSRVLTPVGEGRDIALFKRFVTSNTPDWLTTRDGVMYRPECRDLAGFDRLFERYLQGIEPHKRPKLREAYDDLQRASPSRKEFNKLFAHRAILKNEKQYGNDAADRVVQACDPKVNVMTAPFVSILQERLAIAMDRFNPLFFTCGSPADVVGAWVTDKHHRGMQLRKQDISKCDSSYLEEMVDALMVIVEDFFRDCTFVPGTDLNAAAVLRKQLMECRGRLYDILYDAHTQLCSGVNITTVFNTLRSLLISAFCHWKTTGLSVEGYYRRLRHDHATTLELNPAFDPHVYGGHTISGCPFEFCAMGTGDDSGVAHDPKLRIDFDASALHTKLKSEECTISQFRYCSKMFYITNCANGQYYLPGMLIGRALIGLGTQHKKPFLPDAEFVRGVALGLAQDNNHVPVVGALIRRMLHLTQGEANRPIHEQHVLHASRAHQLTDDAYHQVFQVYGLMPHQVQTLEAKIDELQLGEVLVHAQAAPFIDEVTDKDNEISLEDDTKQGPPNPVQPASAWRRRAAHAIASVLQNPAWACVVAPLLEESVKRVAHNPLIGAYLFAFTENLARPDGAYVCLYRAIVHQLFAHMPFAHGVLAHAMHNAMLALAIRGRKFPALCAFSAYVGLVCYNARALSTEYLRNFDAVKWPFRDAMHTALDGAVYLAQRVIYTGQRVHASLGALSANITAFSLRSVTPLTSQLPKTDETILSLLKHVTPTYGNHGGPGTDTTAAPIDQLDAAFKDHDEAYAAKDYTYGDHQLVKKIDSLQRTGSIRGFKQRIYANAARNFFAAKASITDLLRGTRSDLPSSSLMAPIRGPPRGKAKAKAKTRSAPKARRAPTVTAARVAPANSFPRSQGQNIDKINGRNVNRPTPVHVTDLVLDYVISGASLTQGQILANIMINPTIMPNCPRLNALGKLWARYGLGRMYMVLSVKAPSTAAGGWGAYFDPDPNDDPSLVDAAKRMTIAVNHKGAKQGTWWGAEYRIEAPHKAQTYYTDFKSFEYLWTVAHRFVLLASASSEIPSGMNLFSLRIFADFMFMDPTIEAAFAPASGAQDIRLNGATSMTGAMPLGVAGSKATGSLAYSKESNQNIVVDGETLYQYDNVNNLFLLPAGRYFVQVTVVGTVLSAPTWHATGVYTTATASDSVTAGDAKTSMASAFVVSTVPIAANFNMDTDNFYFTLTATTITSCVLRIWACSLGLTKLTPLQAALQRNLDALEANKRAGQSALTDGLPPEEKAWPPGQHRVLRGSHEDTMPAVHLAVASKDGASLDAAVALSHRSWDRHVMTPPTTPVGVDVKARVAECERQLDVIGAARSRELDRVSASITRVAESLDARKAANPATQLLDDYVAVYKKQA